MTAATGKGLVIADVARDLLGFIVEHYAVAGVDLPVRRYLTPGDPEQISWDCEQLTIGLQGVGWGWIEGNQPTINPKIAAHMYAAAVRHSVLSVRIVRCTPKPGASGKLPSVESIDEAGALFMRDAGLLSQAMVTAVTSLRLGSDGKAEAGTINPLGPSGGYHGLEATLAITAGSLE